MTQTLQVVAHCDANALDPVRQATLELPVSRTPALAFSGVATRVGARRLTEQHGKGYQVVRAGDDAAYLQHRSEPGFPPLYKLIAGQRYQVELFKVRGSDERKDVPYDRRSTEEAIFYAKAWPFMPFRDEADVRRLMEDWVIVQTEGLCVRVRNAALLQEYGLYKVVVRRAA